MLTRRMMVAVTMATAVVRTNAEERHRATLYKTPDCGCCEGYADYLRQNGIEVESIATHDLSLIKRQHRVPERLDGCHTTIIGRYVIEGHVPIASIRRLLRERPAIRGISLPGMPDGSPGMSGQKAEPFIIFAIDGDGSTVFARE